jgi:dephospho-CoA kinase
VRVALTGGIATGKSTVARALRAHAVATIDADRLARDAVAPGTAGLAAVIARFGAGVALPAGDLDRAALGRIVFADRAARADLERIIHPYVRREIDRFVAAHDPPGLAVAEIPLAYETGWFASFDVVVVAACHPRTQERRLRDRDGLTEADARARLRAQWPIADKARLADAVILTDGDLASTEAQVAALVRWLGALRARPRPS